MYTPVTRNKPNQRRLAPPTMYTASNTYLLAASEAYESRPLAYSVAGMGGSCSTLTSLDTTNHCSSACVDTLSSAT